MPIETLPKNDRVTSPAAPELIRSRDEDALRALAVQHLERVRRFRQSLAAYVLYLLVLTPVWIVTQYESADGWPEHLSTRSRYPGDWDPWILWVALVGGVVVAVAAYRAYVDRPTTEADVEREMERLRTR
jgi:hypothetical protein